MIHNEPYYLEIPPSEGHQIQASNVTSTPISSTKEIMVFDHPNFSYLKRLFLSLFNIKSLLSLTMKFVI